jgi:hypothetical protein
MNNIQKICLMVGIASLAVLWSTWIDGIFDIENWYYTRVEWDYNVPQINGSLRSKPIHFFFEHNFMGTVALFNIVASALGFFLFKEK